MEVSRDDLQYLADQPLGAPHLQEEAERKNGLLPPSAELSELCKRVGKKWLPLGRKSPRRGECNVPAAEQTDLEDAVEAAGGKRGRTA